MIDVLKKLFEKFSEAMAKAELQQQFHDKIESIDLWLGNMFSSMSNDESGDD